MWVQSIDQADFLRSRPFLQLRFSSDGVANVSIMFVIDQGFALIPGSEPHLGTFAVLVSPAREAVRHPDVKNRMFPVRNDIDPEVVITRHESEIRDVSTPLDMTKAHPLRPR